MEGQQVSPRSRLVASLLAGFLGIFGAHRFYTGKIGSGLGMIFTLGGLGVWYLVDNIMILSGEFRDIEGRRVLRWTVDEEGMLADPARPREPSGRVLEEMETMRHDLYDLQERVDFMERMLTDVRQKQRSIGSDN